MNTTSPKIDPAQLVLKTPPRRIVRFRRALLVGLVVTGATAVFAVMALGLKAPARPTADPAAELFTAERALPPDGLASLPAHYGQTAPAVPALGPPLPGDLGRPIVERQRQLGLDPAAPAVADPAAQAAAAERQRQAQQAVKASEAGVFFTGAGRGGVPPLAQGGLVPPVSPTGSGPGAANAGGGRNAADIYNPHVLQTPASPYQVMAGSVIAASLITGLNSDLPGLVVAQVTENVHDTVTGRTLLIPQGARLIGRYDSAVGFAQSRARLVWQRLVMPNGASLQLDDLPATDMGGYAGLEDEVDHHTGQLIKGVALSTLLGVGTELTFGTDETGLVRAVREAMQQNVNRAGQRLTEKTLDVQPTLTIRPGWPLRVIVHKDLILQPYRG